MTISALYILNSNGKILISRDYRGDFNKTIVENFMMHFNQKEETGLTPVFIADNVSFVFIKTDDLFVVAVIKINANVTLALTFLSRLITLFSNYLIRVEEESIKDNFVIIYELLDEIMDYGYPQLTDPKILQTYITQESYKLNRPSTIPAVVTNIVSWRPEGIKYSRNELFIDVIESVHLSVNHRGTVLQHEVAGRVQLTVHLSGMPQLRLGLSDAARPLFDDVKFHQCVQLSRVRGKDLYFVPPDGRFELLAYRFGGGRRRPPLRVRVRRAQPAATRVEYVVEASAQFRATSGACNLEIVLPVAADVDSPRLRASLGAAAYVPELAAVVWKIKYLAGGGDVGLRAQFRLPSLQAEEMEARRPLQVKFTIPYFTISGLHVRFIKIIEKNNYRASTWVQYLTQNGEYTVGF